jgi:NAD(P)-dependent dehydrogenase (short-subunit alcohol dehydrogenase family)
MPFPLPNASTDLSGQVALVTGASAGLGYRFARVLAAAGARVAIAARRMGDIAQYFPRKRIATPAQMDSTLLFLASPASEAVTGTAIRIDDGQGSR